VPPSAGTWAGSVPAVPDSPNPRSRRAREAERQRAEAAAVEAAYERARRRRAAIGIGVVAAVVIAVVIAVYAATNRKTTTASTTTTTARPTTTVAANTVPLPTVAPGAALAGVPPCPAADGSSPRTTEFAEPPPMCLDLAQQYEVAIQTSAGTIKASLDTTQFPQAANLFAFLAGYHYYDGLPISRIVPAAYAEVDNPVNGGGRPGPGFSIPNEAASRGPVLSPLTIALVPEANGTVGGAFLMGLAGQFAQIPANAPQVGMILDDRVDPNQPEPEPNVRQAVNKAATPSGGPSQVVTVERITVTPR